MIKIEYTLPNINHIGDREIKTGEYRLLEAEYIPNYGKENLWR